MTNTREITIREHLRSVERIARHIHRRLPRSVDVGDLIQAGAVGLVEAVDGTTCTGKQFLAFLYLKIHGAMLDWLRDLRRSSGNTLGGIGLDGAEGIADLHATNPAILAERAELVARGLAVLANDDREVVAMRFEQDLTFAEIGQRFGFHEGTAHRRLREILQRMAKVAA